MTLLRCLFRLVISGKLLSQIRNYTAIHHVKYAEQEHLLINPHKQLIM